MSELRAEDVVGRLRWRYATERFDPSRRIDAGTWAALEEALVLSPSSFGLQPWKFIVVENAAARARLQEASWNQPQVTDASHLVVLARRSGLDGSDVARYMARVGEVRGTPARILDEMGRGMVAYIESGAVDLSEWNARQVYIALGFFLTAAAMMGIDACPMEGIDVRRYDEILDLPRRGYLTTVAVAAGFRAAEDPLAGMEKVRFEKGDVVERM